jgi:hypothetical protein
MKKLSFLFLLLLTTVAFAQKNKKQTPAPAPPVVVPTDIKIPMTADQFLPNPKLEFVEHRGLAALKITEGGTLAELKDVVFENGTIEFDVEAISGFAASCYFRRQNDKEQEIFYFRWRQNALNYNDAVQYTPVIKGVNMWNMYPQYQAPALQKEKDWNHVKMVVSGLQMRVYVNDMSRPALEIPRLEGNTQKGSIAFDGNAFFSNLVVKPNITEGVAAGEGTDLTNHDAHYLRKWTVSQPRELPFGNELFGAKLPDKAEISQVVTAERFGLINLSRLFGSSETEKDG